MNDSDTQLFVKAILQGYIYFRDRHDKNKIHKGFIVKYITNLYLSFLKDHLEVAYGVNYYFHHPVNGKYELYLEDCDDEFIKDLTKHPAYKECYSCELISESRDLDAGHYGTLWALTKEELK